MIMWNFKGKIQVSIKAQMNSGFDMRIFTWNVKYSNNHVKFHCYEYNQVINQETCI